MKANIPDNVRPIDWLMGMMLLMSNGYSAEDAQDVVIQAAEKMEAAEV